MLEALAYEFCVVTKKDIASLLDLRQADIDIQVLSLLFLCSRHPTSFPFAPCLSLTHAWIHH